MDFIVSLLPMIAMLGLAYFLLIVPEKKRNKQYNAMISELKINDEILTRGGIIGKIVVLEEDYIVIESSKQKTQIKLSKNGIATKLNSEA